jgi:hypothetical protein
MLMNRLVMNQRQLSWLVNKVVELITMRLDLVSYAEYPVLLVAVLSFCPRIALVLYAQSGENSAHDHNARGRQRVTHSGMISGLSRAVRSSGS